MNNSVTEPLSYLPTVEEFFQFSEKCQTVWSGGAVKYRFNKRDAIFTTQKLFYDFNQYELNLLKPKLWPKISARINQVKAEKVYILMNDNIALSESISNYFRFIHLHGHSGNKISDHPELLQIRKIELIGQLSFIYGLYLMNKSSDIAQEVKDAKERLKKVKESVKQLNLQLTADNDYLLESSSLQSKLNELLNDVEVKQKDLSLFKRLDSDAAEALLIARIGHNIFRSNISYIENHYKIMEDFCSFPVLDGIDRDRIKARTKKLIKDRFS